MDATELGRWSRFASKGGIGKCTALQDYVAEEPEDLMFMKVACVLIWRVILVTEHEIRMTRSPSLCSSVTRMMSSW